MADVLGALLGLDIDDEEQAHALAQQLRREKMTNDYFALSSTDDVRDNAISRNKSNLLAATTLGKRRRTDAATKLTNQRADARNEIDDSHWDKTHGLSEATKALAQKKYEDKQNKRGDVQRWINADGDAKNVYQDSQGKYFDNETGLPANLVGWKRDPEDYSGYRSGGTGAAKRDIYGNNVLHLGTPEAIFAEDSTPYSIEESIRRYDDFRKRESKHTAERERLKAVYEKFGDVAGGSYEALLAANGSMNEALIKYDEIFNAVAAGAFSGKGWKMTPTLREATATLESAADTLALQELQKHKLYPISDKDIEYVKSAAMPDLYGASLQKWVTHKKEATRRMMKANTMVSSYIREYGKIAQGADKQALEAQLEQVLHGGGFEFAFDIGAAQGGAGVKRFTDAQQAAYDDITDANEKEKARQAAVEAGYNP
jgi:hypothetical protein